MVAFGFGLLFFGAIYLITRLDDLKKENKRIIEEKKKLRQKIEALEKLLQKNE